MKGNAVKYRLVLLIVSVFSTVIVATAAEVVGRPVKVAAAAIGYGGEYKEKMAMALEHIHVAAKHDVDILCLPEAFCGDKPESVPGTTTDLMSTLAREYGMYIICPIVEQFESKVYNTAVLLDRQGNIAGKYRKIFVFWSENVNAGEATVPVFDTEFGRIAMLTCFDLNFPELWLQAEQRDVDIMFWPSAFGGGKPLNGYASIHAYYIVAVGDGDMIDMTGEPIPTENPMGNLHIATIDLDRTLVHKDYTREKVKKLLDEHAGEVELERDWHPEGWFMLRAAKAGVLVRQLLYDYEIETLREYRHRSREQINARREAGERIVADDQGNPK